MQGKSINITINSAARCPDFTYKVTWYRDNSHQTTVDYGGDGLNNLVKTFDVPANWPIGSATATIYTYYNGTQIGSGYSISFTIQVDTTQVFPTYNDFTITLVNDYTLLRQWNLYVQGYSRCSMALTSPAAETNPDVTGGLATITDIYFRCGEQSRHDTAASFTTGTITEFGSLTCEGIITNSYGNQTSAPSSQIYVHQYFTPSFGQIIARRVKGQNDATPTSLGTYLSVSVPVVVATVNGNNRLESLTAQFKHQTEAVWSEPVIIIPGETNIIGDGNLTLEGTYEVRIVAVDTLQEFLGTQSVQTGTVDNNESVFHVKNGGLNVSFGMEGARDNAIEINPQWDLYFGSTNMVDVLKEYSPTTVPHHHAASDINDGILPLERGGTGVATQAALRNMLQAGASVEGHTHALADLTGVTGGKLPASMFPFAIAAGKFTIAAGTSGGTVSFADAGMAINLTDNAFASAPAVMLSLAANNSTVIDFANHKFSVVTGGVSTVGFTYTVERDDTADTIDCYYVAFAAV